jgi:hypothetical protein
MTASARANRPTYKLRTTDPETGDAVSFGMSARELERYRTQAERQTRKRKRCQRRQRLVLAPRIPRGRAARPACNARQRGSRRSAATRGSPSDDPDDDAPGLARLLIAGVAR